MMLTTVSLAWVAGLTIVSPTAGTVIAANAGVAIVALARAAPSPAAAEAAAAWPGRDGPNAGERRQSRTHWRRCATGCEGDQGAFKLGGLAIEQADQAVDLGRGGKSLFGGKPGGIKPVGKRSTNLATIARCAACDFTFITQYPRTRVATDHHNAQIGHIPFVGPCSMNSLENAAHRARLAAPR